MAIAENYLTRRPFPKTNPLARFFYLGIIFILTIGPLIGFSGTLLNMLFATGIVLSFGIPALIVMPFLSIGGALGLWYAFANYREHSFKERRLKQICIQLKSSIKQLDLDFYNEKQRSSLVSFLTTLANTSPDQTKILYERYKMMSDGEFTFDDFVNIQKALRNTRLSPYQTFCHYVDYFKLPEPGASKQPKKSLFAQAKNLIDIFFSAVTINSARSAQATTLIIYSLLSVKLAFVMLAGILGFNITWPFILTGFLSVFTIALGIGVISAISTSHIFNKTQEQEIFIQKLKKKNRQLEIRNHLLNELSTVTQYLHLNSQGRLNVKEEKSKSIPVIKTPIKNAFRRWQVLYAAIIFFLTAGQVIGFGTAIASGLFVAGVAALPIGVTIVFGIVASSIVTGILLGLWHAIGIHRDLTRKITKLHQNNDVLIHGINVLEEQLNCQSKHPALFQLIKRIKESTDMSVLYREYHHINLFEQDDLTEIDFRILKILTERYSEPAEVLKQWSHFRRIVNELRIVPNNNYDKLFVLMKENNFLAAVNKWAKTQPRRSEALKKPNCVTAFFSSLVVNPFRAAQATGLLAFSLISLGLSIILAAVAAGITIPPMAILGGFIGTIFISATLGAACALVVNRLMSHVRRIKIESENISEKEKNMHYRYQLLKRVEIRAKAFVLASPEQHTTEGTSLKNGKNPVYYLHPIYEGVQQHAGSTKISPLPESNIPEECGQVITVANGRRNRGSICRPF